MALSIGIVGLPNVGKSTLFNALTKAQNAQAANYPFCTIEPNKATVMVPDERLGKLSELVKPEKTIHATVDFIDIAGLVRGASAGEGLGNQFLGNIRETAAILQVVRCFENDDVTHVDGVVDPLRDVETIETELLLADVQSVEKRLEKISKQAKGDKDARALRPRVDALLAHLNQGAPAATFPERDSDAMRALYRELGLLSAKKTIFCANVDENSLARPDANPHVVKLREFAEARGAGFTVICAQMEQDLHGLDEAERAEFLESYGVSESGLNLIIRAGYEMLDLISYFTAGPKEVRAWTIGRGWKAPQAAGVIHSDFERGFIRAEVISYDDYLAHRSEAACRAAGVLRVEGKEYVVQDDDVVHFLFNV